MIEIECVTINPCPAGGYSVPGETRPAGPPEHGYAAVDAGPGRRGTRDVRRGGRSGRPEGPVPDPTRAARPARPSPRGSPRPDRSGRHPCARTAQALPARDPWADARPDLLGFPRPALHDRRGDRPARHAHLHVAGDRPLARARFHPGPVRGRRARGDRDRPGDPARPAPRAVRREPPPRGVPDPRPDLLGDRDAIRLPRSEDRARVRAGHVRSEEHTSELQSRETISYAV